MEILMNDDVNAPAAIATTSLPRKGRRWLLYFGPAFIASIAYVDPGNFATNIQGGARYGYLLLWVVVASNLVAMLIQSLSAKLGIATGRNLAELCREHYPRPVVWALWVLMELVAIATDLAEFLGAALGFYLLLGIPLLPAGVLTAVITFLILSLERYGFRPLERIIMAFVGVIAVCYVAELFMGHPDWHQAAAALVRPRFADAGSVVLAVGILGATVMPHVIFLHSSLMQGRMAGTTPEQKRHIYRFEKMDVVFAMSIAGLVNAAMLIMAAAAFYTHGQTGVGTIEEAHKTLAPLLGKAASTVFAISLLASGLSSSMVGTLSGQVIMQGFLQRHIPVWLRRLVTMLPSLAVIAIGFDPTRILVLSQVLLSFGLPFAVVPLVRFTSRKDLMGDLVNGRATMVAAVFFSGFIILLNLYLIYRTWVGGG